PTSRPCHRAPRVPPRARAAPRPPPHRRARPATSPSSGYSWPCYSLPEVLSQSLPCADSDSNRRYVIRRRAAVLGYLHPEGGDREWLGGGWASNGPPRCTGGWVPWLTPRSRRSTGT